MKNIAMKPGWLLLAGILLLFSACAAPTYRLYRGSPRPAAEIAILESSPEVYVKSVDGVTVMENIAEKSWSEKVLGGYEHPLAPGKRSWYGDWVISRFRMELPPGPHTLMVRYGGWYGQSTADLQVSFQATAGKTYTVKHSVQPEPSTMTRYGLGWRIETRGTWNAWVEEVGGNWR